jgi:hypothetical protein
MKSQKIPALLSLGVREPHPDPLQSGTLVINRDIMTGEGDTWGEVEKIIKL